MALGHLRSSQPEDKQHSTRASCLFKYQTKLSVLCARVANGASSLATASDLVGFSIVPPDSSPCGLRESWVLWLDIFAVLAHGSLPA